MLPVKFAIEGPGHLFHLFVEHRHLVRFQSLFQVQRQFALVQSLPFVHHHQQFQGTSRDGVLSSNADTVLQSGE